MKVSPAIEELEFTSSFDNSRYTLTVEVVPYLVARTLMYRDPRGNPIYWVRWWVKQVPDGCSTPLLMVLEISI